MSGNSSRARSSRKTATRPEPPYDGFPLYAHPSGKWAKKILGKIHYFGRWGRMEQGRMVRLPYERSWKDAKAEYDAHKDNLHAGRVRRNAADGALTLADLCNRFLTAKLRSVEAGELTRRSFQEYKSTTDRLIAEFGKTRLADDFTPEDFGPYRAVLAERYGPVRLGNEITRIKSMFRYAASNKLIVAPVAFGSSLNKPSKQVLRKHKAVSPKRLFTAAEIRLMLDALAGNEVTLPAPDAETGEPVKLTLDANPAMRAAVLLGINAGAGNTDVANLEFSHLDLKVGWLNYPRGKTGIGRRVPLWPETITAIKAAIAERPTPADSDADGEIVLLTARGERLVSVSDKSRTDGVAVRFGALLRRLGINGRKGIGFYSLRHTLATIGLQTADRDAVRAIMGQVENDVLAAYDETGPSDERLRRVTDHVRAWLFGTGEAKN